MVAEEYAEGVTAYQLLNKGEWHAAVDDGVTQAQAEGLAASVLFIDVNFFKRVNDKLGHLEGDRVLEDIRGVVAAVMTTLRTDEDREQKDVLKLSPYKYEGKAGAIGGDEIGIFAFTDSDGANKISERVREAFKEYLDRPDNWSLKELGIGLSIGRATLQEGMISSDLIGAADKSMYEDKEAQLPKLDAALRRTLYVARFLLRYDENRLRDLGRTLQRLYDR